MLRKTKILMFDESTSALDNQNEKIILKNLKQIKCTLLTVAHRVTTVKDSDSIFLVN